MHILIVLKVLINVKNFLVNFDSTRQDVLFDVHNDGGPKTVWNFIFSNLAKGGIKNWLQIRIK